MIKIDLNLAKKYLDISGHAMSAPRGQDIVCAAVSANVQMLLIGLCDVAGDDIAVTGGEREGYIHIQWEKLSDRSEAFIDTFYLCCANIARQYPDNVRIVP